MTYFTGYPTFISCHRMFYCNIWRNHPIAPLTSSPIDGILEARGSSCENPTSLKMTPDFRSPCHIWSYHGVPCNIEAHFYYYYSNRLGVLVIYHELTISCGLSHSSGSIWVYGRYISSPIKGLEGTYSMCNDARSVTHDSTCLATTKVLFDDDRLSFATVRDDDLNDSSG